MTPHLSQCKTAGPFLFISGQLAFGPGGRIAGDAAEQTKLALERMEAILRDEGLTRASICKCTIWLSDAADFARFNEAYADFFQDHRPARSTVVSPLVLPEALVEIEAVAFRGRSDGAEDRFSIIEKNLTE